ncbi:MAG TPA: VOC family protein [Candidatus Limnocylindrales bacterium]|nr:VOC family protein [Candidatus Limnocylindrales bacterium]
MSLPPAVHHVALRTGDIHSLAAFYAEMLGLPLIRDLAPRSLWLGLGGDAVLMIESRQAKEPTLPDGTMDLVAFRVDAARKAAVREAALARGCFDGETEHTVYVRDPDHRRVGVSTYEF